jgi:hypothetical protein
MDLEGNRHSIMEVLTRQLPAGTEANHKNIPVRTAGFPAENRTEEPPNTNLECYRYTNLLFVAVVKQLHVRGLAGIN